MENKYYFLISNKDLIIWYKHMHRKNQNIIQKEAKDWQKMILEKFKVTGKFLLLSPFFVSDQFQPTNDNYFNLDFALLYSGIRL